MTTPKAPFDVQKIRKDFPVLNQTVNKQPLVYLDTTATSQKPYSVIESVSNYYINDNANVHRGIHSLAARSTKKYENSRQKIADFIGAGSSRNIIFTRGTTEAINLVATSFGSTFTAEDEIIVSLMEHHSNFVPWQLLSERTGCKLKFIQITENGELDMNQFDLLLTEKTKLVAVVHISNVLGTVNPIEEIVAKSHNVGAKVLIDGAQSVPHVKVDVQKIDCDFFAFSAHKMMGPTGIGALYAKEELLKAMPPYHGGGEMIHTVTKEGTTWADIPYKFEAGTPNIAGVIGWGVAIDYINQIGIDKIHDYSDMLTRYAIEKLSTIDGLTIYGNAKNRGAAVSFNLKDVHPHDVSHFLDQKGIAVRAGHHCAQPLMTELKVDATNRASFYIYNTFEEVDKLVEALKEVKAFFTF